MVSQFIFKLILLSGDFLDCFLNLYITIGFNISILLRFKLMFILENKQ